MCQCYCFGDPFVEEEKPCIAWLRLCKRRMLIGRHIFSLTAVLNKLKITMIGHPVHQSLRLTVKLAVAAILQQNIRVS